MRFYLRVFLVVQMATVLSSAVLMAQPACEWSQFRGSGGMGIAASPMVTTNLDVEQNLVWKSNVAGVGWSSPVSDGEKLWMTAAIITDATKEQRAKRLANVQMAQMKDVAGMAELQAVCLDAISGKLLFQQTLAVVDSPNPIHPMNSYASPTPAVSEDRVIFHFGGYGTWCLDKDTGKTQWTQQLVVDDSVGPGSSPVIVGDKVLIVCDGIDQQFVAALGMADGGIVWRTTRPPMRASNGEFQKAYSTPLVINVNGQTQAVVPGAQWCVAYDPQDGRELWQADHGSGFSVTPMAIYADGLVVFSTGYTSPELVAVDPSGTGDVTNTHIRWRIRRNAPTKPSLTSDAGRLYAISDDGILSAINLSDGEMLWRERIGGSFSASPMISGKNIFIASHEGELTIFRSSEAYEEVAKIEFDSQIMASPISLGNDLIIRTKDAIYRFADQ